jgi:hypothetical protein
VIDTVLKLLLEIDQRFVRAHYGEEFRLDVIDASTDAVIGTSLLTTQGMLQNQRDLLVAERGASMFQFLQGPLQWRGKQLLKLELRTGVKSAFGNDFFVAAKGHRAGKGDEEAQPGERDVDEKM